MIPAKEAKLMSDKSKVVVINELAEKHISVCNEEIKSATKVGKYTCRYFTSDNVRDDIYLDIKRIVVDYFKSKGFKIKMKIGSCEYGGDYIEIRISW